MLRKSPGFTLVAVLSLALGIGINTAIFGALRPFIFVEPPVRDCGQIANILASFPPSGLERGTVSWPEFQDIRERQASFQSVAAYEEREFRMRGDASAQVRGMRVSAEFFRLLGVKPMLGRVIRAGDNAPGAESVAVVSYAFWQRRLGGDASILGRSVWLDNRSVTIIGVMQSSFWFPVRGVDAWVPFMPGASDAQRARRRLRVIARLKNGVSIEQARAEMAVLGQSFGQQYPETDAGWRLDAILLREDQAKKAGLGIALLFLPVFFVLLIACGNVTNLLLARTSSRRQEIAMRTALGAGRGQIVQQLLTESALLAAVAGTLGILLAYWGMYLIRTVVLATVPDITESVQMDLPVLGFALFICVMTPLMVGLAPALEASRLDLVQAIKAGKHGAGISPPRRRERELLVLAEVALVGVMLVPTGLMLKAMLRLGQIDLGFDAEHLLTLPIRLSAEEFPDGPQVQALERNLVARIATVSGVQAAAIADRFPGPFGSRSAPDSLLLEDMVGATTYPGFSARRTAVSPGYFAALGLSLQRGRAITDADSFETPLVAVVSESAARRFWPSLDPLGRRFRFAGSGDAAKWITVVGVVGDVKAHIPGTRASADSWSSAQVYTALAQHDTRLLYLLVRTQSASEGFIPALKKAIRDFDRRLPMDGLLTMRQRIRSMASEGYTIVEMLGVFAGLALALAGMGVYGVLSLLASQRTHEIGVRVALGAQRGHIFSIVLYQGMWPVFWGLLVGLAGGYALSRLLAREIGQFGVKPTDLATFAGAAVLIVAVAFLGSFTPARRATRVEPMAALRCE